MTTDVTFDTGEILAHVQEHAQEMLDRLLPPGFKVDITLIASRPGEPKTASCASRASAPELIDILAAASAFVMRRPGRP